MYQNRHRAEAMCNLCFLQRITRDRQDQPRSSQAADPNPKGSQARLGVADRSAPHRSASKASWREIKHWWSLSGSNRRPPACKAGALPAELKPRSQAKRRKRLKLKPRSTIKPQPGRSRRRLLRKLVCAPRPSFASQKLSLVGPGRFELPTSPLSGVRSNQLSYGPKSSEATTSC